MLAVRATTFTPTHKSLVWTTSHYCTYSPAACSCRQQSCWRQCTRPIVVKNTPQLDS